MTINEGKDKMGEVIRRKMRKVQEQDGNEEGRQEEKEVNGKERNIDEEGK